MKALLSNTDSVVPVKCWALPAGKKLEKFRGAVGLAQVAVDFCGAHVDPTGLISDEVLKMLHFSGKMCRVWLPKRKLLFSKQSLTIAYAGLKLIAMLLSQPLES